MTRGINMDASADLFPGKCAKFIALIVTTKPTRGAGRVAGLCLALHACCCLQNQHTGDVWGSDVCMCSAPCLSAEAKPRLGPKKLSEVKVGGRWDGVGAEVYIWP
jgi:hypothetical protein